MSFDATKSTKGASKLRRDLINAEIATLRDLLPLPSSTRQRLSQLQLMALVCVYVRKANYFQQVFRKQDSGPSATPNFGFSKALSGFLMMTTQNGKLLYISDNAAEYLGHSMEDLLIHGDSVYDIIDKQDHQAVQAELLRTPSAVTSDERLFLCRMNVSRNARRQMRFGDQKVVLMQGHFLSFLPLCSRNEPVFLATCTPIAMPETRECVVQGATHVFTSIHSMDMKFLHIDKNAEHYLGYTKTSLQGVSWYQLVHWEHMREAQAKHRLITQSEQDRSGILLLRLIGSSGVVLWVHVVLQVKDNMDNSQQPVVVCTNQVLSDKEASVMRANSWLYHYYSVQNKLQYGLTYESHPARMPPYYPSVVPYTMAAAHTEVAGVSSPYIPSPQPGPSSSLNGSQHHLTPTMPPPPHQYGFPPPGNYHHLPTSASPEARPMKRRAVLLGPELSYGSEHHTNPCWSEMVTNMGYGCVAGVLAAPVPLPAGPKLAGRKYVTAFPEEEEPWTASSPPWVGDSGSQTVPDLISWNPRSRSAVSQRKSSRSDGEDTETDVAAVPEQFVPDSSPHRHTTNNSVFTTLTSRLKNESRPLLLERNSVWMDPQMPARHYRGHHYFHPVETDDVRSNCFHDSTFAVKSCSPQGASFTTSHVELAVVDSAAFATRHSMGGGSCGTGSSSEPDSPGWLSPAAWPLHLAARECSRCTVWTPNPTYATRFTFDAHLGGYKRDSLPSTPSGSPQASGEEHSHTSWTSENSPHASQVMGHVSSCIGSQSTPCQDAF